MVNYSNYWSPSSKIDIKQQEFIPKSVDVAIIGGGIAGLLTAKQLLEVGIYNIAIFEESSIGSHSSARSNGFLQFKTSKYFHKLENKEVAKEYARFIIHNNSRFIDFIKDLDLYCELDTTGGVEIAMTNEEYHNLEIEYEFLKGLDLPFNPVLVNHNQVSKILPHNNFMGGMYMPLQATFNPQRLMSAICNSLESKQNKIYINASVENIEKHVDDSIILFIKNSGVVKAKKVVYCTNAYSSQLLPEMKKYMTPIRGTTIVTTDISPNLIPTYPLMFDSGKESIRSHGGRILYSSLKQQTKNRTHSGLSSSDRQVSATALDKFRSELIKKIDYSNLSIEYTWSSISCETTDGLPFIGEYDKNQYILAGFNGHGFSHVYSGSKIIKDLILKNSSDIHGLKIFNPKRLGV
jgi:glycine/D-amino acid oxidase-like deaminating enzyme